MVEIIMITSNLIFEEFHWKHPQQDVYELAGCGSILAVLCVVIVVLVTDYFPESAEALVCMHPGESLTSIAT